MAEDLIREVYTQLDLRTNDLAALPREDRIAWFRRNTYAQPLHFLKEISGTTYAVRAFFDGEANRKNSDVCSAHYIREKVVEQLVLESMQRIMLNVQVFEKEFARKQMTCYTEEKKKQLAAKRRELERAQKRIAEIDILIQKIYEDNASGKLSDERYATLSMSYEKEQQSFQKSIAERKKTETA